ncbi:MAG: hypothetical protein ACYC46_10625 [Acidobacteriaceae bacterium]
MRYEEFCKSLQQDQPPPGTGLALAALWWDAKGQWEQAHEHAQVSEKLECAWVHAYLHRKEGDQWNAGYWYRRAGQPMCSLPLHEEWEQMVKALLPNS